MTNNEAEMMQVASAGHDFEIKVFSDPKGENRQITEVATGGEVLKKITDNNPALSVEETSKVYEPALKIVDGKVNASWVGEFSRMGEEIALRHYSPKTLRCYLGWMKKTANLYEE